MSARGPSRHFAAVRACMRLLGFWIVIYAMPCAVPSTMTVAVSVAVLTLAL